MNRKRRKAIKMLKRRLGKATNSGWRAQTVQHPTAVTQDVLLTAMRELYRTAGLTNQ